MRTPTVRRAAAVVACLLIVAGAAVLLRHTAPAAPPEPVGRDKPALAAVLVPDAVRCEIVVVDLERRVVLRRIRLRSLATDVAVDEVSGHAITAQAGGIGQDSDDVLGDVDLRAGTVRYVPLPQPNPGSVVCSKGSAYALHGLEVDGRMVASVVDVRSGRVTTSTAVPPTSGVWQAAFDDVWTVEVPKEGASTSIVRLGGSRLDTVTVYAGGGMIDALVPGPTSLYALYGASRGPSGETTTGSIAALDPATGARLAGRVVPGLAHGPTRGAVAAGRLAVIGWDGEPPEDDRIALLDAGTLADTGSVRIGGVPCALAGWGAEVVAVDRLRGRLVIVDPVRGAVTGSVDLGATDLIFSDVEVLPHGAGDAVRTAQAVAGRAPTVR